MTKVIIAVVGTICLGIGLVNAGELQVNFDGESNQGTSFMELTRMSPVTEAFPPVSAVPSDETQDGRVFYKLGKADQLALLKVVFKTENSLLDRDILSLISDEKTDILYNDKAVFFVNALDGNRYTTLRKSDNKRLIGLLQGVNPSGAQQTKQAQVICKFVEMVLWELVKGVWTEVRKQVKECYTETDPGSTSGGSSPSNGSGGGGGPLPNVPINPPVRCAGAY